MILRDNIDIYTVKRVLDGYGGHKEEKVLKGNIPCKITAMTTQKQSFYFGALSVTACSIITKEKIDYKDIINIDNRDYKVLRVFRALNNYVIDVEVVDV